jgi:hypothetical protein
MQNLFDPKSFQTSMQGLFNGMGTVSQGWEPWLKAAARCQLELMGLASRRLQAYMELPARVGACHTPQELAGEQLKFWQAAVTEYAECYGRLVEDYRGLVPPPWSFFQIPVGTKGKDADEKRERDYIAIRESDDAEEETAPSKGSRRAA